MNTAQVIVYTIVLFIGIFIIIETRIHQVMKHYERIFARVVSDAILTNNLKINEILAERERLIKNITDRMIDEIFDGYEKLEQQVAASTKEGTNDN